MRNFLAKTFLTLTILGTFTALNFGETAIAKYRIEAYKTRIHQFYLKAGTNVDVELFGDGYTNLDLFVYDGYGNLIVKKEGSTDVEIAKLTVYRGEYFTIKIVNRSNDYNDYDLRVWEQ